MATAKNFIDFVLDAKDNRQLAVTFMQLANTEDFIAFFADHGYDIAEGDIGKIIEARRFFAEVSRPHGDDRY